MLEHLERIRQKPKQVRAQYAFWLSLLLTLVVVGIWGLFQRDRFSNGVEQEEALIETKSSFFGELGEIFSGIGSLPSLFKGKVEYSREEEAVIVPPKTIDLEALVASSTKAQKETKKASTTEVSEVKVTP
ncbi:MAG: hypothetical protein RLZZ76_712 [Candidatus Parcubacteria bacterium]|jgi:hypothetical protein